MIKIELMSFMDAFNDFDSDDISDALEKYILEKAKMEHTKKITIKINGNYTMDEKKRLEDAIHTHYKIKNNYLNKVDRYDDIYRLVFMIIGAVLIYISSYYTNFIGELFLIIGWVAVWEVTYDLLFKSIKRKTENSISKKLSKCKIIFED